MVHTCGLCRFLAFFARKRDRSSRHGPQSFFLRPLPSGKGHHLQQQLFPQEPQTLSVRQQGSGLQSGRGRGGFDGLHPQSQRGSRCTHTSRLPQASTPRITSAHSPGRQGFSIVTRRHSRMGGMFCEPHRSPSNSGTLTQGSPHADRMAGNRGICP